MPNLPRRIGLLVASATLITAAAVSTVPAVSAASGDVIRTGNCTGSSDWKLKLSKDNGRIQVEFEVDSNRIGQTWITKIKRNGNVLASGYRVTKAPSGSFTFRASISDRAGIDTVVGRARNLKSGEICRGVASI
jgi:hypothetical protein